MGGYLNVIVWTPDHFQFSPPSWLHTLMYIPHMLVDVSLHTDLHYYLLTHIDTLGIRLDNV